MLIDQHGRRVDYLRVSVTDRCNLRCIYCMPPSGTELVRREEILSYEEISRLVTVGIDCGIRKVRITGGEPLVRKDVQRLISALSALENLEEISLTTNGVLLEKLAPELKSSGLRRVNISLDSLRRRRFEEITTKDELPAVRRGIDTALHVGLTPVKLNVVVRRGMNEDELLDFASLTQRSPLQVRFIEYMGLGVPDWRETFYPLSRMRQEVSRLGRLQPVETTEGNGPARYFKYENSPGRIGFIAPISQCFCAQCNRLRLTSDGKLRSCLLSNQELDLRGPLRAGASAVELRDLFKRAVATKVLPRSVEEMAEETQPLMCSIGG